MKKVLVSALLLGLSGSVFASGPGQEMRNMAEDMMNAVPAPWTFGSWMPVKAAIPGGDAARGEKLATEGYCYTCHGDKGVAPSRNAPSLAGQDATFLFKALHDYKSGRLSIDNKSLGMQGITQPMSEQDMADLATFYSSQPRVARVGGGAPPASVSSCTGCHQANGAPGMGGSGPGLSGMSSDYIVRQLEAFKSGQRNNDVGSMMSNFSRGLSPAQMREIGDFFAGK